MFWQLFSSFNWLYPSRWSGPLTLIDYQTSLCGFPNLCICTCRLFTQSMFKFQSLTLTLIWPASSSSYLLRFIYLILRCTYPTFPWRFPPAFPPPPSFSSMDHLLSFRFSSFCTFNYVSNNHTFRYMLNLFLVIHQYMRYIHVVHKQERHAQTLHTKCAIERWMAVSFDLESRQSYYG